jgi:hypothetical protein
MVAFNMAAERLPISCLVRERDRCGSERTGLLGGGVRAVCAGLWPVADTAVRPFMWRFYRNRLLHDLPGALARTQREELASPDSSPLFWAAFALFGDPAAFAPPGLLGRWFGRRRYRRHCARFPV